jgi:DnaJ family protein B protein 12
MDSNRDEAERCIDIAVKCISSGDNKKALRFLKKAENLYSTKKAKELISRLISSRNAASGDNTVGCDMPSSASSNSSAPGAHGTEGTTRRRRNTDKDSGSASGNEHHDAPKYTEEQLAAVKNIHKCKNYYEILSVAQDCNEEDLKKAYKKLALKFHPDKNHAPGATEAFKAIGNAFAVLSNPEKRQRYDQFGSEEEQTPVASHRYYHQDGEYYEYDFSRGFEGDISAEELFNMFFGGGFQTVHTNRRVYRHRATPRFHHQNHRRTENTDSTYTVLFQLAPILFLLVISLVTAFLASEPTYSPRPSNKFTARRVTSNLRVPYYVKPDFSTTFKGSLQRLEQQVEEDHINNLKSNCLNEKSYRESILWQARSMRDSKLYEETLNRKLPSCEALREIYG